MRIHSLVSLVVAATLFPLGLGCSVSIRDRALTALRVGAVNVERICPGTRAPIAVIATVADGEQLVTQGPGGGDVRWSDFQLRVEGGHVERDGFVRVDANPETTSSTGVLRVTATSVHHTLPPTDFTLPVVYTCAFQASFRGSNGATGRSGSDGSDGADGSRGTQRAAPGAGRDGRDGGPGGDGGAGIDAPDVMVSVSVAHVARIPHPLLQVDVSSGGRSQTFYVDPAGGTLTVDARGGNGGRGGHGGDGGDGGDGGSPASGTSGGSGPGGHGAHAEFGGNGGPGGAGGLVMLSVQPGAEALLQALEIRVDGGGGGRPGNGGRSGQGGSGSPSGRSGRAGEPGHPGEAGPPGRVDHVRAAQFRR